MFINSIKAIYKNKLFLIAILIIPIMVLFELMISMSFNIRHSIMFCKADAIISSFHPFLFSTLIIPLCFIVLINIKRYNINLNTIIRFKNKDQIWFVFIEYCLLICLTVIILVSITSHLFSLIFVKSDMTWQYYSSSFAYSTNEITIRYSYSNVFVLSILINTIYFFMVELVGIFVYYITENDWIAIIFTIIISNINILTGNSIVILNDLIVSYQSLKRNTFGFALIIELSLIAIIIILGKFLFKRKEFLNEKNK